MRILAFLLLVSVAHAKEMRGKVVSISDGDILTLLAAANAQAYRHLGLETLWLAHKDYHASPKRPHSSSQPSPIALQSGARYVLAPLRFAIH